MVTNLFLLSMLISSLAGILFLLSMLIRLIKREDWKEEGKRFLFFLVLTNIFFVMFGLSIT